MPRAGCPRSRGRLAAWRTQQCAAEELTSLFAPDTFDFVGARNCIDHSRDALLAMQQMLEVVKPGCSVLLHHAICEADRQGFQGMHQWNFYAQDGDFWISRLTSDGKQVATNVNESLRAQATITTRTFGDEWMHNVITKLPANHVQRA